MRKSRPFRAVLETENGRREFDCLQFVVGNGRFHAGPFPVAPDASIVSGALNVYAVEGRSKWTLLEVRPQPARRPPGRPRRGPQRAVRRRLAHHHPPQAGHRRRRGLHPDPHRVPLRPQGDALRRPGGLGRLDRALKLPSSSPRDRSSDLYRLASGDGEGPGGGEGGEGGSGTPANRPSADALAATWTNGTAFPKAICRDASENPRQLAQRVPRDKRRVAETSRSSRMARAAPWRRNGGGQDLTLKSRVARGAGYDCAPRPVSGLGRWRKGHLQGHGAARCIRRCPP